MENIINFYEHSKHGKEDQQKLQHLTRLCYEATTIENRIKYTRMLIVHINLMIAFDTGFAHPHYLADCLSDTP